MSNDTRDMIKKGLPSWFQNLLLSAILFFAALTYSDFRGIQAAIHTREIEFVSVRAVAEQNAKDIRYMQETQYNLAEAINKMAQTMARLGAIEERRKSN